MLSNNKDSGMEINNFLKGKLYELSFVNLLRHGLKWDVKTDGLEHRHDFYCKRMNSIFYNQDGLDLDESSRRILIEECKRPDIIAVPSNSKKFLRAEIRLRPIGCSYSDFISNLFVKDEFELIREYFRGTKLLYLDPENRELRMLDSWYSIDDQENQNNIWSKPEQIFLINKTYFKDLTDMYIFDRTSSLAFSLLDYCSEEEKLKIMYSLQDNLFPSNRMEVIR